VDLDPLTLLWLMGALHNNDWFRALTIAWQRTEFRIARPRAICYYSAALESYGK